MTPTELQSHFRDNKHLAEPVLHSLLAKLSEILDSEPNVLYLASPIIVCGDIHGQLLDLFQLFQMTATRSPDSKYLFLGDYVDRGYSSIETFAYLSYLKVRHQDQYFLLRGNHESREVSQMYGLYKDCQEVYGNSGPWYEMNSVFDLLPLAAVIDDRIVCVHGGLSPMVVYVDQVLTINRKHEIDPSSLGEEPAPPSLEGQAVVDLTWSDPENVAKFMPNRRGRGQLFGPKQTQAFLRNNGFVNGFVARSHQIAQAGWDWQHDNNLVIVWSAPNYCYTSGNDACVMHVPATDEGEHGKGVEFWKFEKDPCSDRKPEEKDFELSYFA